MSEPKSYTPRCDAFGKGPMPYIPNKAPSEICAIGWERMAHELEIDSLSNFQREVTEWASATFPDQTPASKASHLHDEAIELMSMPGDPEEMADIFILLCNLAQMHGYDLLEEARKKMAKNRAREWGPPDARGVCHHIEIGTEEGQACGRDGCAGIIELEKSQNCSCFISAPCESCLAVSLHCPVCHWVDESEA